MRTGVVGDSYRRLLARARIVCHLSPRHKCGRRAFEAAAAGALVFQEAGNRELPALFRDRQECVYYPDDELEPLLEHCLTHEDERRLLAEAARERARHCSFAELWERLAEAMAEALPPRGVPPSPPDSVDELEKALAAQPRSALLGNAVGAALGRQTPGRTSAPQAAEVAAEFFRAATEHQPNHVVAGLNLAEALEAAGQQLAAIDVARHTLEILQRDEELDPACLDAPFFGKAYDTFGVEWERAAWTHAGQREAERQAKHTLLRWRLYTLLGLWTGDLACWYEAASARPDLPSIQAGLGGTRWADVVIDHVGYQDPRFPRGKLDRNLRLLELDHADLPDDAFNLFNLGWTLLDQGRTEEALRHLQAALTQTKPTSSTLRKLYQLLAVAQQKSGQGAVALTTCREALQKFPDAELLLEEGMLLRAAGDLSGAELSWNRLLDARRALYFASEEVGQLGPS